MNVLEKISEEIKEKRENLIDMSDDEPELHDVEKWYDDGVNAGKVKAYSDVEDIIHSHMNNHSGDFNEMVSKWIPVEERLPEDGTYLCTLDGELYRIDEPFTGMCGIENGKWDEEGYVIAWQPIPKPYRPDPCKGCFGAANNDCGKCEYGGGSSE